MLLKILYYCAIGFFVAAISDLIVFPNLLAKYTFRLAVIVIIYAFIAISYVV